VFCCFVRVAFRLLMSEEFYKGVRTACPFPPRKRKNAVFACGKCDVRNAMYEFAICHAKQHASRFKAVEVIKRRAADLTSFAYDIGFRVCSSETERGVELPVTLSYSCSKRYLTHT
jgi:hypothetical protein